MYYLNGNKVASLTAKSYAESLEIQQFVPDYFVGKDIFGIYDEIEASIRYPGETLGINMFYLDNTLDSEVKRKVAVLETGETLLELITPNGTLQQKERKGYTTEHYVKTVEDLKAMLYFVEHTEFKFNQDMFEAAGEALENYGLPTCYYFRSPFQKCILEYLGYSTTIKFLRKYPHEMEEFMNRLSVWDEAQYKNCLCPSPIELLNVGDNIDCSLVSPPLFEKYHIPHYESRVKLLHDAGKFVFAHFDGSIGDLLPYLASLPFDGLEALTPFPQGDVSVQQIIDNIGDKILVDGIPATVFMPEFPEERLIEITQQLLEGCSPHLILGISDELPPNTDGRRLKKVAELVRDFTP
jgi:hypothetical protein